MVIPLVLLKMVRHFSSFGVPEALLSAAFAGELVVLTSPAEASAFLTGVSFLQSKLKNKMKMQVYKSSLAEQDRGTCFSGAGMPDLARHGVKTNYCSMMLLYQVLLTRSHSAFCLVKVFQNNIG